MWIGLLLNGWVLLILWLGGLLPAMSGTDDTTFQTIQQLSFGIHRGVDGGLPDRAVHRCAAVSFLEKPHQWPCPVAAEQWINLISQLVDTSAVVLISHYGAHVLPVDPNEEILPQLIAFIGSGYLFKLLAALADTLPFIWLTGWLRRWLEMPADA